MPARARMNSRWPLPSIPARPMISPRRTLTSTSENAGSAQSVHLEDDVGRDASLLRRELAVELGADDQLDDLLLGQLGDVVGALTLAVAQDRESIGDRLDLADAVRDVDDGAARVGDLPDAREQACDVVREQVLGRLVQHQDLRRRRQRLDDLDDESLLRPQALDTVVHVDADVRAPLQQELERPGGDAQQRGALRRRDAEVQVLGDRQVRHQRRLLAHDRQAQRSRALGIAAGARPVDGDVPALGDERAGGDGHQGGLAGAVLSDDGVDLSGTHGEGHVVQRPDTGEHLRDPVKLEHDLRFVHGVLSEEQFAARDANAPAIGDAAARVSSMSVPRRFG